MHRVSKYTFQFTTKWSYVYWAKYYPSLTKRHQKVILFSIKKASFIIIPSDDKGHPFFFMGTSLNKHNWNDINNLLWLLRQQLSWTVSTGTSRATESGHDAMTGRSNGTLKLATMLWWATVMRTNWPQWLEYPKRRWKLCNISAWHLYGSSKQ